MVLITQLGRSKCDLCFLNPLVRVYHSSRRYIAFFVLDFAAEGFPRADVDLLAVRTLRQRVIVLTNDYKAKQREVDALLQQLHALGPAAFVAATPSFDAKTDGVASGAGAAAVRSADGASARAAGPVDALEAAFRGLELPDEPAAFHPFARVDEVSPGSPAAGAGLQVGDRIAVFGSLISIAAVGAAAGGSASSAGAPSRIPTLADLGSLVRASQGISLPLLVLRASGAGVGSADALVRLTLTPQAWAGAGLLGCHVVPV